MSRLSTNENQPGPFIFSNPHDILMDIPISIFTSTPQDLCIAVNQAMPEMSGYENTQVLNRKKQPRGDVAVVIIKQLKTDILPAE